MTGPHEHTGREIRLAPGGLFFGRYFIQDLTHNEEGDDQFGYLLEIGYNNTDADLQYGRPLVRCRGATGGAESVAYNTMVVGGADAATNTNGCFLNFAGVSPFVIDDNNVVAGNRVITLMFPSITTVPAAGVTLTQATSGATGTVVSSSTVYNYVIILDLGTGTWNTTNTVTESGATMVPPTVTPRSVIYGGELEANSAAEADGDLIWYVVRGYVEAFVIGATGTGANGAVTDCSGLTWNDDVRALCAADYNQSATTGPDNIIAFAMEAVGTNSDTTPELILVYLRADEPLVYVEDQGTVNAPQA